MRFSPTRSLHPEPQATLSAGSGAELHIEPWRARVPLVYPPGANIMRCNDWRLDLGEARGVAR
jgi:hypothetical protein